MPWISIQKHSKYFNMTMTRSKLLCPLGFSSTSRWSTPCAVPESIFDPCTSLNRHTRPSSRWVWTKDQHGSSRVPPCTCPRVYPKKHHLQDTWRIVSCTSPRHPPQEHPCTTSQRPVIWKGYLSDVSTIDVLPQSISVERLALWIVSRESILRVRNKQTTIRSTFKGAENTASRRRPSQSNVKEDFEWSASIFNLLGERMTAIRFNNTFVFICKTNLGQSTTSNEEASGICSSPILESMFNPVLG